MIKIIDIDTFTKYVEKRLDDVEFYSPTMPLHYEEYHEMIRALINELKKPMPGHGEGI